MPYFCSGRYSQFHVETGVISECAIDMEGSLPQAVSDCTANLNSFLDYNLSPCSECYMLSSG